MKDVVPPVLQITDPIAKVFAVFSELISRCYFGMLDSLCQHVSLRSVRLYGMPNMRRNKVNRVASLRNTLKSNNREQFAQIRLKLIPCQCEPPERGDIRREFWLRISIQVLANYFQTRQRINASRIACTNSTALNDVLGALRAVTFSYIPRKSPSITSNSNCFIYAYPVGDPC